MVDQVAHPECEQLESLVDEMLVEDDKRVGQQPKLPVGVGHHPRPLASSTPTWSGASGAKAQQPPSSGRPQATTSTSNTTVILFRFITL